MAIRPKPAFHPIFEVAIARKGSGIALINQTPQTQDEPEASESCSWWRRGRVELWRLPLQLWMHSVISPGPWPAWQTPLMKPAQIRWNREDGSLALPALTQGTDISR